LATEISVNDVLFVATAEARDEEMKRRISIHRESRPATWLTMEQTLNVGKAIASLSILPPVILLDCLTLLVTNVLLQGECSADEVEQRMRAEIESLQHVVEERDSTLIVVSGEVGMGVVPETPLGRMFRDLLGMSNQSLAARADATYIMVAGHPINTTKLASSVQEAARGLLSSTTQALR
jgi:adenosylcobinamide kinase/adenosylcobinamide-phosphate guanylyltransferase